MLKLFLTIYLYFHVFSITQTHAQTSSTPETSANSATSSSEEVKNNIRERIKQVVESQTPSSLSLTNTQKQGWLGFVESITADTLTLNNGTQPRLVGLGTDTQILHLGKVAQLEDISIDGSVVAVGYLDHNEILNAQQIIINDQPPSKSTKKTALVTITNLDTTSKTLTLSTSDTSPLLVKLSKTTTYSASTQDPISSEPFAFSDLFVGDKLVLIYQSEDKDPSILMHY